jgi:DHA1 family bicyclomycin/chloramphenicol resistance-like MFS transporter
LSRRSTDPRLLAPLLGALAMLAPFAIDTFFPAFPDIEREFGISPAAMQQSLSIYLLGYAAMSLLHGALSDAYGRRRVVLLSLSVFALATVGCALAHSLPQLLVFRLLQGTAGGAGVIIGRAIVRDCFDGEQAVKVTANVTLVFAVAPAFAPIIGGWVLLWGGWRMIFWLLAGFVALLLLTAARLLPETHPSERRSAFSAAVLGRNYAAIVRDGRFLISGLILACNFASMFVYIADAPSFVLDILHLGRNQFGWLFMPLIGGMMVGARLSGMLAGKALPSRVVALGFVFIAGGALGNLGLSFLTAPSVPWAVLPMMVSGIGVALAQPTITLQMLDRFPAIRGAAASVQASITLGSNALVSAVVAPLVVSAATHMAMASAGFAAVSIALWLLQRRLYHR